MKRVALVTVLALALVLAMGGTALAGGGGAVQVNLYEPPVYGGITPPVVQTGTVAGSVTLNTTASGYLNVLVNLDDAAELVDYDVRIFINYNDQYDFVDSINTNAQGQGNGHFRVPIPASATGETIIVAVNLGDPVPPPVYGTGNILVPLK